MGLSRFAAGVRGSLPGRGCAGRGPDAELPAAPGHRIGLEAPTPPRLLTPGRAGAGLVLRAGREQEVLRAGLRVLSWLNLE
jgi:hypothetical protein